MSSPEQTPELRSAGQRFMEALSGPNDADNADNAVVNDDSPDVAPESVASEPAPSGEVATQPEGDDFGSGLDVDGDQHPPQSSPAPTDPWLQQVQELGFENVENVEQARERVVSALQQSREREQQYASYVEQIKPLIGYGRQYLELQRDPQYQSMFGQQAQTPATQDSGWWNPPEVDQNLVARWRENKVDPESGEVFVGWKDNTPASVRSAQEAYDEYIQNWQNKLVYNPKEALGEAVRQEAERLFQEEKSRRDSESSYQSAVERFTQQHADLIWEKDPYTNQPIRGRLSAHGKIIQHYVEQAESAGTSDPQMVFDYAMLRYQRDMAQRQQQTPQPTQPPTAQPPGKPTQAQRQMNFLQRGSNQTVPADNLPGNMGGSLNEPNRNLSPGNRLLDQMRQDAVI